jgi:hypothetical protein
MVFSPVLLPLFYYHSPCHLYILWPPKHLYATDNAFHWLNPAHQIAMSSAAAHEQSRIVPAPLAPALRSTILRVTKLHAIEFEGYRVTVEESTGHFISKKELRICTGLFHSIKGAQHALQTWSLSHELDGPQSCLGSILQYFKTRVYVALHRKCPVQLPPSTHDVQVNPTHGRRVYCQCAPGYEVEIDMGKSWTHFYGTFECEEV